MALKPIQRCSLLLLLATTFALAQTVNPPSQDIQKSCRNFVQAFYKWYVPIATKHTEGPASDVALKNKSSVFSPELLRSLSADSQAQAKAKGEIVGLDSDPFLGGQDSWPEYVLDDVTVKDNRCWVPVFGISLGKRLPRPDVVPELMFKDGRWFFVNFHYGKSERTDDENLVSILKALHSGDPKGSK